MQPVAPIRPRWRHPLYLLALGLIPIAGLHGLFQPGRCSKQTDTKMVIKIVEQALVHYQTEVAICPSSLDELQAQRYLIKPPRDAWGHALRMQCPGDHNPDGADLISAGRDGIFGTADDLHSWEL